MLEHEYLAYKTHQAREKELQRKNGIRRNLASYFAQSREDRRNKKARH